MDPIHVDTDQLHLETVTTHYLQPEPDQIGYYTNLIAKLSTVIADLEKERSELLGVEVERRTQIDQRLSQGRPIEFDDPRFQEFDFSPATRGLKGWQTCLQGRIELYRAGFRSWLPLEPLLWRHPTTNLPVLALFSLESGLVGFELSADRQKVSHQPNWPFLISQCYGDVLLTLRQLATELKVKSGSVFNISTTFSGTIPTNTKARITAAMNSKQFSLSSLSRTIQYLYLLAEVEEWTVGTETIRPVRVDPIVVGWSQHYPNQLFYIDAFDITPLENTIPIVF